jgi:hypothetical protein
MCTVYECTALWHCKALSRAGGSQERRLISLLGMHLKECNSTHKRGTSMLMLCS